MERTPLLAKVDKKQESLLMFLFRTYAPCLVNVYEPFIVEGELKYKAENPSPLNLLGAQLGFALVEIMSVSGSYLFVSTHMKTMFPRCAKYNIIDYWFGTNTGVGWLCEASSIALWTFPLVCCTFAPFFHYHEFCDQRLYYEALRYKLLIKFPERAFFTHPVIVFIKVYMLIGLSYIAFGHRDSLQELHHQLIVLVPFLLPLLSYVGALWMRWDLQFFLMSLARFADHDLLWAQDHLNSCLQATEMEVKEAHRRWKADGYKGLPENPDSPTVFFKLRELVEALQKGTRGATRDISIHEYALAEKQDMMQKDWSTPLMWLPRDAPAKQFRLAYRVFLIAIVLLEVFLGLLFISTVLTYLQSQGHFKDVNFGMLTNVRKLVVEKAA